MIRPRFCKNVRASEIRGRRECRVRAAPAVSRAKLQKKRTRAYRFSGGNPAFPAQWFYGLLRALPGDQACLTPSPALLIADLTPASGRQNDTTWPYASGRAHLARCRVHRIPTRVRDVRETPLCGSDRQISELIWVRWQAKFSEFRKLVGRPFPGRIRHCEER